MAVDNNENIVIETAGLTAAVATDVAPFGGITSHFQLIKLAYGVTGSATVVSGSSPLPVAIAAGLTATISGFTGTIQVQGVGGSPVAVSGTVYAVGLSGSPTYVSTQTGSRVEVTGGRPSSKTTDSISVFGPNGNTWAYVNIVDTTGAALGNSGNPLYTIISGATIAVTINPTVGVTNDVAGNGLRIQGTSGGLAVATTVGNTVGINDTNLMIGLTNIQSAITTLNTNLSTLGISRPTGFTAGRTTITTIVSTLAGYTTISGIQFKASSSNTDLIYINSDGVATIGYELDPGESLFFDIQNLDKIYLRAKTSSQVLSYLAS